MSNNVAVVILNYNGEKFLQQFLPNVVTYSQPHRVIVADNASTDNSKKVVEQVKGAKWLALPDNYGYAEGYNKALKQISAEYYVLLNSDVEVTENWLKPLLKHVEANAEVVACQPKIKSFHQPGYFEYAGAAGGYLDWMGVPFCRGRIFDTLEQDHGQYNSSVEVHWATGACLFVNAAWYWKVGGLDGRFFAHMEEIDLCWRLRRWGKKIACIPASQVYHVGGGTLSAESSKKLYLNYRNGWWMLIKNLPKQKLVPALLARLAVDKLAAMRWLAKGEAKKAWAIFRAIKHALGKYGEFRRDYPQHLEAEVKVYNKSIIAQYFGLKQKTYSQLPNKPD